MTALAQPHAETHFDRDSWIVVAAAGSYIVIALIIMLIGLRSPSDGWLYDDFSDERGLLALDNLSGDASPLQPGDVVTAVDGQAMQTLNASLRPATATEAWRTGGAAHYTVIRNDQTLELDVILKPQPLTYWWRFYTTERNWIDLIAGFTNLALALFVFLRRPRNLGARALLLVFSMWLGASFILTNNSAAGFFSPAAYFYMFAFWGLSWAWWLMPALITFVLVFPVRKGPMRRHARLEATLTPDAILPGLVETVAQTLKLPYVAVALQVGDQLKVQAESGQVPGSVEAFPLIYQGQPIGQLWVALRSPGEAFNPSDRLLLTNIARQAGAVAHAVQLTAALQQSRQQLVTAREEERRRLRRDLHDGLGPQLASQTLTLNAIGKLLERDPAKARELLDHLRAQSQAAIEDIRRLVYELRPPALDELGLVAALREGVRQYGQVGRGVEITTDPHPLPTLSAAVEVAVYRIAQEAITNVIRHAPAQHCRVAIGVQDHHLDLTIADDGPGFPPDVHIGVGFNSMRERAEELGGHIRFENQPQGGARVQIWLPLPGDEE